MRLFNAAQAIVLVTGAALTGIAPSAGAQAYPTHAITMVVPFAAGGPTDVLARTVGAAMSKDLGQSIVIENRLGAGGTVAVSAVAKAKPDGYTLLIHHNGMATAPSLYRKLSFDPMTDFEYIGLVADVPMTLLGSKKFPPNSIDEFIKYARANGDKVNLATAGLGAVSQLCGTLLQGALETKFTAIPYQGTGPAMTALLGGQVDVLCDQTTQTLPQIKSDKVKLYGVTTLKRIPSLPDAPTLNESGLKGFEVVGWHGIYAPKGTPKNVVDRINAALKAAMKDPNVIQKANDLGAVIVDENRQTPAALQAWLKSEIEKWGPPLKAAGEYAD